MSSKLVYADHMEGARSDTGGYTWELELRHQFISHQVFDTFCKSLGDLSLISGQLNICAVKRVAAAHVGTSLRTEWAGDSASSPLPKDCSELCQMDGICWGREQGNVATACILYLLWIEGFGLQGCLWHITFDHK